MLKLSAVSVVFFTIATSPASACILYNPVAHTFTNTCKNAQYVEYRTVGGGCYISQKASTSLKPNERRRDKKLADPCDAAGKWNVVYGWCGQTDWENGSCRPRF